MLFEDLDTELNISSASSKYNTGSIAVLRNCNPEKRHEFWRRLPYKRIPGSEFKGCGINSLAFLEEITIGMATRLVANIQPDGTPVEQMINWLNRKSQTQIPFGKRLLFIHKYTPFVDINETKSLDFIDTQVMIRKRIWAIYKKIYDTIPENSCMLVKYERNETELFANSIDMTPGHTLILTKYKTTDGKVILASIDPQQANASIREIRLDDGYMISENAYKTLIIGNYYRGLSYIVGMNASCNTLVNMVIGLPDFESNRGVKDIAKFLLDKRPDLLKIPDGSIYGGGGGGGGGGGENESYIDIANLLEGFETHVDLIVDNGIIVHLDIQYCNTVKTIKSLKTTRKVKKK